MQSLRLRLLPTPNRVAHRPDPYVNMLAPSAGGTPATKIAGAVFATSHAIPKQPSQKFGTQSCSTYQTVPITYSHTGQVKVNQQFSTLK